MERVVPRPLSFSIDWPRLINRTSIGSLIPLGVFIALTGNMGDANIYYTVPWPPDYSDTTLRAGGYQYSPAFALWVQPLQALDWTAFRLMIVAVELAALVYLVGAPLALLLVLAGPTFLFTELRWGNLNLVATALVMLSLRHPSGWAFAALTKITPLVGAVWPLMRGDWRAMRWAIGTSLLIALPALLLAPETWVEWMLLMPRQDGEVADIAMLPPSVRIIVGIGLVAWGARTGRLWTVPLAVAVSFPVPALGWVAVLGLVKLYRDGSLRVAEQHDRGRT